MKNIHPTSIIGDNVKIGNNVTIGPYCVIGNKGAIRNSNKNNGTIIIDDNTTIMNFVSIMSGEDGDTIVGKNNLIMNYVNIGHNSIIGDNNEIGTGTIIAGWCRIGNDNKIKLHCTIRNRVVIGDNTLIGMGSNVVKNITSNTLVKGNPIKIYENE
jgi:acyl-[acyl carrier protein]--UDP-N-acetylglucosamine O-acyltransferase